MDVVVVAFVMLAVYCAARRWPIGAAAALALAVGAKVWPIVLLPLLLRGAGWRLGTIGCGVFGAICSLMAWPILAAGLGETSGFTAYSEQWVNNSGAFGLIEYACGWLIGADDAPAAARLASTALVGLCAIAAAWCPPNDSAKLANRAALVTAMVFMLSPTQFPWYYVWLLPLLAVAPRWSLLAYTPLLSLYYWQGGGTIALWLQHAPVWFVLIIELTRGRPRWKATCTSA